MYLKQGGTPPIRHGVGYDLITESFSEQTSTGERDIKNAAFVIYDKHGNTTELIIKRKIVDCRI
jgi:hypothetical protein